ncbi:hypothetical protein BGX21_006776, partial [Mortierella sp. AD011]
MTTPAKPTTLKLNALTSPRYSLRQKKGAVTSKESLQGRQENETPPQASNILSSGKCLPESSTSNDSPIRSKRVRRSGTETNTAYKPVRGRPPRLSKSKAADNGSSASSGDESEEASSASRTKKGKAKGNKRQNREDGSDFLRDENVPFETRAALHPVTMRFNRLMRYLVNFIDEGGSDENGSSTDHSARTWAVIENDDAFTKTRKLETIAQIKNAESKNSTLAINTRRQCHMALEAYKAWCDQHYSYDGRTRYEIFPNKINKIIRFFEEH